MTVTKLIAIPMGKSFIGMGVKKTLKPSMILFIMKAKTHMQLKKEEKGERIIK